MCAEVPLDVRRSVQAFVYETMKRINLLDEVIRTASDLDPRRVRSTPLRWILRVGVLEMKVWNNPPAPVTDCMVRLAKEMVNERAGGLVNAVLRRVESVDVEEDVLSGRDPVERLALEHGHPKWFVEYCMRLLGRRKTELLLRANNRVPPQYLRLNTLMVDTLTGPELLRRRYGIVTEPTFLEEVRTLIRGRGYGSKAWREGLFDVQDLASACASAALPVEPGDVVLDVCAAPGSKTTHLAQRMMDEGKIYSIDIDPKGLRVLERRCRRLGITCVETVRRDARRLDPDSVPEPPDAILVDPPCSTTGVWNRNPDSRWKPKPLRRFARREWSVLRACLRVAEEYGCPVVYSTCSVSWEENEAIVKRAHDVFGFKPVEPDVPGSKGLERGPKGERFEWPERVRRYWPFRHDSAGFFVSLLEPS